jgi:hypothetical protein
MPIKSKKRQLRPPTEAERLQGLPATKAAALEQGITRFVPEDGEERIIRQYGSKKFPTGSIEKSSSRKVNRGAGARQRLAQASTPPGTNLAAFGQAMASAASRGLQGHHIVPLFLSGKAVLDMTAARAATYFERFEKAGIPLGDTAENIMPVSETQHRQIHREGEAVQRKLQSMESKKPSRTNLRTSKGSARMSFREVIDTSTMISDTGFSLPGDDNPFGGRTVDVDPLFTGMQIRLP